MSANQQQVQIADDWKRGFITCADCDDYVFIFRVGLLRSLPDGYSGELCQRCSLWVCAKRLIEPDAETPKEGT